jgi:hypothetical protein
MLVETAWVVGWLWIVGSCLTIVALGIVRWSSIDGALYLPSAKACEVTFWIAFLLLSFATLGDLCCREGSSRAGINDVSNLAWLAAILLVSLLRTTAIGLITGGFSSRTKRSMHGTVLLYGTTLTLCFLVVW